jgi:phytoene dehydrogenase-like protein
MVNAPVEAAQQDDDAMAPTLEAAWARLRRSGVVDDDARIVWQRTPRELAARFPGSGGSIYGASSNGWNAAFLRPKNRASLPGLYLASGSAHPGGGVPLCLQSGLLAADALLEDALD